jgi:hypothetical protein
MGVVGGGDGGAFWKDLGKAALAKERAVVWETCTRLASTTADVFSTFAPTWDTRCLIENGGICLQETPDNIFTRAI